MATNTIVFILLLVLLALTYGATSLDLGSLEPGPRPGHRLHQGLDGADGLHARAPQPQDCLGLLPLRVLSGWRMMICGFENDYMSRPLDAPIRTPAIVHRSRRDGIPAIEATP
jgi:hypothetical protein